jgi:crossover junction endodeoxyribonuclease RusA
MSSRSWTVTIPAPARFLNANHRTDRRAVTPVRRAWREAGTVHARAGRLPQLGRAHVTITFRFTDRRRRDVHNLYPTAKAIIDGLVDAGVLIDDSDQYLTGPDLRVGEPIAAVPYGPVGQAVLTIREVT